jgi:hypothetical protein
VLHFKSKNDVAGILILKLPKYVRYSSLHFCSCCICWRSWFCFDVFSGLLGMQV